jgi:hypothetical protein
MYECNAPYAPVYAKASENKGPPVKTLGRRQCIEAKELRSDDGRRWLRFTNDSGQSKPPSHFPFVVCFCSQIAPWRPGLFTPWADVEGRPLWTPQGERPTAMDNTALATTPLMTTVNRTAEQADDTRCHMRGCRHHAQFKCERCKRFICLTHHVKYRSGYCSYDYCPPCADSTRRLVFCSWPLPSSSSLPVDLLSTSPRAKQALSPCRGTSRATLGQQQVDSAPWSPPGEFTFEWYIKCSRIKKSSLPQ